MSLLVKLVIIASTLVLMCAMAIIITVYVLKHRNDDDETAILIRTTTTSRIQSSPSTVTNSSQLNITTSTSTTRIPIISSTTTTTTTKVIPTTTIVNGTNIQSSYSSILTTQNPTMCKNTYCDSSGYLYSYQTFYETTRLNITVTGTYVFRSVSTMDTYGCLHNNSYEPIYFLVNLIRCVGDTRDSLQFEITSQLAADGRYTLLVTTSYPNITGSFSVIATGPGPVGFTKIDALAQATMVYVSNISVTLTYDNSRFCFIRNCNIYDRYFQAYVINITANGSYAFQSYSGIDMAGLIFTNAFIPTDYFQNILNMNDDSGPNSQFFFTQRLSTEQSYIFVVSTGTSDLIGSSIVSVTGPGSVTFTPYLT